MRTKILYEDDSILVAHKPAGIAVQSANIAQTDVVSELKNYLAGKQKNNRAGGSPEQGPYLGLVHRIDQPVEGVLVFGKNKKSTAELTKLLQNDELNKEYLAVVCGKPAQEEAVLTDYLRKTDGRAVIARTPDGAKKAVLAYTLLDTREIAVGTISLLKVQIETGRFHQIRAQLSHAGYPILGDAKYGNAESADAAKRSGVQNAALCACRLAFLHPVTRKRMEYTVSPTNLAFTFFDE